MNEKCDSYRNLHANIQCDSEYKLFSDRKPPRSVSYRKPEKGNLPRNIVSNYFCTRNLKQPPKSFTQTSSISENISLCFRTDSETNLFGPKTYLIRKDWEGGLGKKAYLPGQFFQSWPCLPSKFGRLGVLPMMYCQ